MSPGGAVAFHADVILARHAILANERLLKRAVKKHSTNHITLPDLGSALSRFLGKERATKPKGRLRERLGQWWVLY